MSQPQVLEAPVTLVVAGDPDVVRHHFEDVLLLDGAAGAINEQYEAALRRYVDLAFSRRPWGLGLVWKTLLPAIGRVFGPIPMLPAVHRRWWLARQAMLSGMNMMLAAHAAGLATVPMEGFDEKRVKKAVGLPRRWHVPLIMPLGKAVASPPARTRLPLERTVHRNRFSLE